MAEEPTEDEYIGTAAAVATVAYLRSATLWYMDVEDMPLKEAKKQAKTELQGLDVEIGDTRFVESF